MSVVVPWLDPEITETAVIQAVFRNYIYAILSGDLEVMAETAGIETLLAKDNFLAEARRLADRHGVLPIIALADWAVKGSSDAERHRLNMPATRRGWTWDKELFSDDLFQALSGKLRDRERIAIGVPVAVRKKDGAPLKAKREGRILRDAPPLTLPRVGMGCVIPLYRLVAD